MDNARAQVIETRWTVDGEDVFAVTVPNIDMSGSDDAVTALQVALDCSRLEAEHAYRVIVEDGEFVASVVSDIDGLE